MRPKQRNALVIAVTISLCLLYVACWGFTQLANAADCSGRWLIISGGSVNVRSGPPISGTLQPPIGLLGAGDERESDCIESGWYRLISTGTPGWVRGRVVTVVPLTPQPTPTRQPAPTWTPIPGTAMITITDANGVQHVIIVDCAPDNCKIEMEFHR